MVESNNEEERDERVQLVLDALTRKPVEPKRFAPVSVIAKSTSSPAISAQRVGVKL
jgi:hypothetical protein